MDNYARSCKIRDEEFNKILQNGLNEDIAPLSMLDVLLISEAFFTYMPREFNKEDINEITMNEDKSVFVKYTDGSMEVIDNPLTIEDLKILL